MRHPIDLAAGAILRWGPPGIRFFGGGWGDPDLLHPIDIASFPADPIPIQWLTTRSTEDAIVRRGTFLSPLDRLPRRSRRGSVISIAPKAPTERTVLLMPAWNEHEPRVRVALAERLTADGITSLILENAYFGSRHPDPSGGHPIRTVADFMLMGASACIEARGLLAGIRQAGGSVGVAGYSMGGNTAALVGAATPFPVAIAALAVAHSPAPVFLDGVLWHGVDWDALGGAGAEEELRAVLGRVSVLDVPAPAHTRRAVLVGARSDAYIPRSATIALADHWPGADMRWEPGGHATLVWLRKDRLVRAITDAFDRLEAASVV